MRQRRKNLFWPLGLAFLMMITFAMTALAKEYTYLGVTEEAYWSDSEPGVARWEKVEKAKQYEVILYEGDQGDSKQVKRLKVKTAKADFKEYMSDGRWYYFAVRAIPTDSQGSLKAGEWIASDSQEAEGIGESGGRWRDYSKGRRYRKEDGSYAVDQWLQISGVWYHFDENGYVQTGWLSLDQKWYYLDSNGAMKTGWLKLGEDWYFLSSDGAMATGWVQAKPGQWYYMDASGKMLSNTTVDGHQLDANGLRIE